MTDREELVKKLAGLDKILAGLGYENAGEVRVIVADAITALSQPQTYDDGLEAAAKHIDKELSAYAAEYGAFDPDTGFTEFKQPALDWITDREELAEKIRAMKGRSPEGARDGVVVPVDIKTLDRTEFEKWAKSRGWELGTKDQPGLGVLFKDAETANAWIGWRHAWGTLLMIINQIPQPTPAQPQENKIVSGLKEAVAYAKGDASQGRETVYHVKPQCEHVWAIEGDKFACTFCGETRDIDMPKSPASKAEETLEDGWLSRFGSQMDWDRPATMEDLRVAMNDISHSIRELDRRQGGRE